MIEEIRQIILHFTFRLEGQCRIDDMPNWSHTHTHTHPSTNTHTYIHTQKTPSLASVVATTTPWPCTTHWMFSTSFHFCFKLGECHVDAFHVFISVASFPSERRIFNIFFVLKQTKIRVICSLVKNYANKMWYFLWWQSQQSVLRWSVAQWTGGVNLTTWYISET